MTRQVRQIRGAKAEAGFSILEVIVSVAIMSAGILAIMTIFPTVLEANERAVLRTLGSSLAMMNIEEIRRDDPEDGSLISAIEALTEPTEAVVFALEPRLAYRYSGVTVLFRRLDSAGNPIDDPNDPRDDPGVARIIIELANPSGGPAEILDEYRFN